MRVGLIRLFSLPVSGLDGKTVPATYAVSSFSVYSHSFLPSPVTTTTTATTTPLRLIAKLVAVKLQF